jgi:hypothetical protein
MEFVSRSEPLLCVLPFQPSSRGARKEFTGCAKCVTGAFAGRGNRLARHIAALAKNGRELTRRIIH